jgi:hypothetical protein
LLDVLAIMIFGIYLQSQMLLKKRRAVVDPVVDDLKRQIAERDRHLERTRSDLEEQTRRRNQSESALRRRDALGEALEGSLGLAGKHARNAIHSLPTDPRERDALLDELNKHRGRNPRDLPAVTVWISGEPGSPVVVSRRNGSALGRITGYKTATDVEIRLYDVLAGIADSFTFVMVGWGNIDFGVQRTVENGTAAAIKQLANRPGAVGRYYIVTLGYQPEGPGN